MTTPQASDKRRVSSYVSVRALRPSARERVKAHGVSVLDTMATARFQIEAAANCVFWPQKSLNCFTPAPDFEAAHSLVLEPDNSYPAPDTSKSPYPTVTWARSAGNVLARSVLPDGRPAVHVLKIMDATVGGATYAPGQVYGFETVNLGAWAGGLGATQTGYFDEDRGLAVTVMFGTNDQPEAAIADGNSYVPAAGQPSEDKARPGDLRIWFGNLWSVWFPGNGDAPALEKKFRYKDSQGVTHDWTRLHTFTGAKPAFNRCGFPEWLVTVVPIAGRLCVSVGGTSIWTESYCYTEIDPRAGGLKTLGIPAAPLRITGRTGGGPRWIGVRRLHWGQGGFRRTVECGVRPADDLTATPYGWVPPIGGGFTSVGLERVGATKVRYTVNITGTADGRQTGAIKWVRVYSQRQYTPGSGDFVDYGGAVLSFDEKQAEPDFSGVGNTRGSDGAVDFTFDRTMLDILGQKAGSDWRVDLAPYAPVTFIIGQIWANADGTGEEHRENVRLMGYFENNADAEAGFNAGTVERSLRDGFIRLKEPAGFIDTSYAPLDIMLPLTDTNELYAWQGVQEILRRAIGGQAADSLKVYLPLDWYPLCQAVTGVEAAGDVTGRMPEGDRPLYNPPYGRFAAEWLKTLCEYDFAALYPAGNVWVYGHYDRIVAGSPVWDVYDGTDTTGKPATTALPDGQLAWLVSAARRVYDTAQDFNRWVVWGSPPDGSADATTIGAPLITAQASDFEDIANTWERTARFPKSGNGGQFGTQEIASRFIRQVMDMSAGHVTATRLELTFPFALPELYWGHKMRLNGPFAQLQTAGGQSVTGKTFRVYRIKESGTEGGTKIVCRVELIELLPGEA